MRTTLVRLGVAAAIAAIAAPATANADGVEKAQFKVTVEGVQRTTWQTNHPAGGGCDVAVTGRGTERVRFTSKPVRVEATVMKGLSAPVFTAPRPGLLPTASLRGTVTRQGTLEAAPDPLCGGVGGGSIPRDCGTRSFKGVELPLAYRLAAKPKDLLDLQPTVIDDPFANCPPASIAFPVLVHTTEGRQVRAELPRDELFDASLGKIIVIARGRETETADEHTYDTRTRWVITFVRIKRGV